MNGLTKGILATLVVGATLLVASPKQAEARRWVYYAPPVVAPAPVYSAYYPVYPVAPRRVYRSYYYAPGYVVPAYTTPAPYIYYGY
jgi:hypothetical protein